MYTLDYSVRQVAAHDEIGSIERNRLTRMRGDEVSHHS